MAYARPNFPSLPPPPRGEGWGGGRSVVEMNKNQRPEILVDPHPNPPHKGEGTRKEFARSLRKNATPAERILWQELRLLKSEGRHFRRQVRIDKYIADFACHSAKLVVELDGGQHGDAVSYDELRTRVLNQHGYRVSRFWNSEIFESLEGVVDRIRHEAGLKTTFTYDHLTAGSTPTPTLPTRGRELE
jgi:very-short-patch-repair endonuclease